MDGLVGVAPGRRLSISSALRLWPHTVIVSARPQQQPNSVLLTVLTSEQTFSNRYSSVLNSTTPPNHNVQSIKFDPTTGIYYNW